MFVTKSYRKLFIPTFENMDYAQFLARMSCLKYPRALLIEHLPRDSYPPSKQFIEETAAKIGVKIYS